MEWPEAAKLATAARGEDGYRTALKATSLTGASALVQVVLRMAKSKVIAVKVGPGGIGMFGVLTAATSLVSTVAGLGLNGSGVRQVAAAIGSGDQERVARVITTLRRVTWVLGATGAALVVLFAAPIARLSAGSEEYARYVRVLAPLVFFTIVQGSQTALLRGLRRVAILARLRILGAFFGTLFAVPLVLAWGIDGIPSAMLMSASVALLASWWYARQVRVARVQLNGAQLWAETSGLIGLGAAFLFTELQASGMQYALRTILLHESDLQTVGQFLAAAALSHVYVDFVLQAMGLDYLPRLAGVQADAQECNRLVNEQTETSMLVAGPGIVAMTVLAPLLIPLLYSGRFGEAVEVFRWQCLGMFLKVASWPVGYVLIARGMRRAFVVVQTVTNVFYLASFFLLAKYFGLTGGAMAFAVLYLGHLPFVFAVVRHATGLAWSTGVRRILLANGSAFAAALACHAWLPRLWGVVAGLAPAVALALWSYLELCKRLQLPLARVAVERAARFVGLRNRRRATSR